MQKLHKLRSPCLKRAVIGLGLVAAFGAGYRFNEAKWQQLTRRQIKENPQNLTQKPFRMDEYTPEGVKTADLAAIDALPFKNPELGKICSLSFGQPDGGYGAGSRGTLAGTKAK